MSSKDKDLKVVDRRKFNPDGSLREGVDREEDPKEETSPPPPLQSPEADSGVDARENQESDSLFISLLSSLAASAQMALGLLPNPASGIQTIDLNEARHVIAMLDVLDKKTRGNLSECEERLLRSILYELKMQFVSAQKTPSPPS